MYIEYNQSTAFIHLILFLTSDVTARTSVTHNRELTGPAGEKPSCTTRTPYLVVRGDLLDVRGNLPLDPRDTESWSLLQAMYRTHAVTWPSQRPWRPQSQPWSREVDFDIVIAQLRRFTGSIY